MSLLELTSYDLFIDSSFQRIKEGKLFDIGFKPYNKEFLNKILQYFENKEKYEECQFLKDIINKRFDHEKNYK